MNRRPLLLALAATALPASALAAGIDAVLLKPGTRLGYGAAVALAYRPLVLYGDGSYSADPGSALSSQPRVDGRWRRAGSDYTFTPGSGKPFNVPASMRARPAPRGGVLQGGYRNLSGVGSPGQGVAVVAVARTLHFSSDGSVRSDGAAGSTSAGLATSSRSTDASRYALDGHTITITGADGRTELKLFYLFPDSDRVIGIGAGVFSQGRGAP